MLSVELRAKAGRLKDLASLTEDDAIRSELLYLAAEYELAASEDESAAVPHVARTTFPI